MFMLGLLLIGVSAVIAALRLTGPAAIYRTWTVGTAKRGAAFKRRPPKTMPCLQAYLLFGRFLEALQCRSPVVLGHLVGFCLGRVVVLGEGHGGLSVVLRQSICDGVLVLR